MANWTWTTCSECGKRSAGILCLICRDKHKPVDLCCSRFCFKQRALLRQWCLKGGCGHDICPRPKKCEQHLRLNRNKKSRQRARESVLKIDIIRKIQEVYDCDELTVQELSEKFSLESHLIRLALKAKVTSEWEDYT